VKRFRGGLVCKAHRLLYHSTPGLRAIKKKKNRLRQRSAFRCLLVRPGLLRGLRLKVWGLWVGVWGSSSLKVQGSGFDVELLVYSAVYRHEGESIFIELMTSDCKLKASRESSK